MHDIQFDPTVLQMSYGIFSLNSDVICSGGTQISQISNGKVL